MFVKIVFKFTQLWGAWYWDHIPEYKHVVSYIPLSYMKGLVKGNLS